MNVEVSQRATPTVPQTRTQGALLALALLLVIHIFNSVDRSIVSILGQAIKEDLALQDWQLGFTSGLGFSFLYVTLAFPLARLADKGPRVTLLAGCTALWSLMTALCGMSGNFTQLLLARMGVGAGEAGCVPTAHSLISDLFPAHRRATALAVFGLGIPVGGLVGVLGGGIVIDLWGWRAAFVVVGLAGIPVAVALRLLVREPPRGRFEAARPEGAPEPPEASFADCIRLHWRSRISRNVLIAMTLLGIFNSPLSIFLAPYVIRAFGVSYSKLGMLLAGSFIAGGIIATLASGFLADILGTRDRRWYVLFPALGLATASIFYTAAFLQASLTGLAICLFFAALAGMTYLAPFFSLLHSVATPRMRATTTALAQFLTYFVGMGLGTLLMGLMIDLVAAHLFVSAGYSDGFAASCPGGIAPRGSTEALAEACHGSLLRATRAILIGGALLQIWPITHLLLAARAIRKSEL